MAEAAVASEIVIDRDASCARGHNSESTTSVASPASISRELLDARNIDRLNIGAMPTVQLNWFQPHEGSIVDFLFRARAYQTTNG